MKMLSYKIDSNANPMVNKGVRLDFVTRTLKDLQERFNVIGMLIEKDTLHVWVIVKGSGTGYMYT